MLPKSVVVQMLVLELVNEAMLSIRVIRRGISFLDGTLLVTEKLKNGASSRCCLAIAFHLRRACMHRRVGVRVSCCRSKRCV